MADDRKSQVEDTGKDAREYLSLLWKGKWIIIPLAIVGILVGFALIFLLPPVYEAETKVLIIESNPSSQILGEFVAEYSSSKEINLQTQLEILNSRQFREEVINELSLKISPEDLKEKIIIGRIGGGSALTMTNVISIKAQDNNPELASRIANTLANSYILWSDQIYKESITTLLSEIDQKLQGSKKALDDTSAEIQSLEKSGKEIPESLNKELELSSDTYAMLLVNYENLKISQTLKSSGASIVETALIPSTPIKPDKKLFLIISFLAGLILGAGIVLLKEYFDNTIKNPDDVRKYYGFNLISQVAYNKILDIKKKELVFLKDPNSLTYESIKELRTNIGYFNVDRKIKTLGITSAQFNEGKSLISANLATALAQSGQKVLLLNADFRKPVLHNYFNNTNRFGITTILTGYTKLEDEIEHTTVENLDFLPSGPIPPNPSELLESRAMELLLEEISKNYDYVIVDTPPIVPVTDAIVLAGKLDAIIVVARVGVVTKGIAKEAAAKLANVRQKILGVILNGVIRKGSYYHYYKLPAKNNQ